MEILAKRLKWLRNKERYSQKEMADKIGMTPSGYQKLELDQREPKLDVLIKLCDIFDVSADFLLGRDTQISDFDMIKEQIEEAVIRIDLLEANMDMNIKTITQLREELIDMAREYGFTNERVIKTSQLLDEKISMQTSLRGEVEHFNNKLKKLVFSYIELFLDIPFTVANGDKIIERYRPYSSYIQMDIFDENQIHLHGNEIGSLGHIVGYKTIEEAEQAQEEILRRLNGR